MGWGFEDGGRRGIVADTDQNRMNLPAAPADVGGTVLAKCEAAMMVQLLMFAGRTQRKLLGGVRWETCKAI